MSKYTTTIKRILNSYPQAQNGPSNANPYHGEFYPWEVVDNTHAAFFNFDYPFYTDDAAKRAEFERAFLTRYYDNYIGFETVTMFKNHFRGRMMLYMPKYKALYNEMQEGYTMLDTTDIKVIKSSLQNDNGHITSERNTTDDTTTSGTEAGTDHRTGTDSGTDHRTGTDSETEHRTGTDSGTDHKTGSDTGSNNNTTNTQSIHSDNPQINFGGNDYASSMDRGEQTDSGSTSHTTEEDGTTSRTTEDSGTTSRTTEDSGTTSRTTEDSGTTSRTTSGTDHKVGADSYIETRENINRLDDTTRTTGRSGGKATFEMMAEYWEKFVNLNEQLINDMRPLFLGLW